MNISLEKLSTRYKIILFVVIIVLIAVLVFAVVIAPQQARVATLRSELVVEQQRVLIIENYTLAHPDASKHIAELNRKISSSNQLLPGSTDIGGFLVDLEQIAKASSIQLTQIQPAPPVNKNNYQEIPITMVVKGNYFQVLDFVSRMEGANRFNSILSMGIQSKAGILEGKVVLNVYAYGVTQAAATSNSPAKGQK